MMVQHNACAPTLPALALPLQAAVTKACVIRPCRLVPLSTTLWSGQRGGYLDKQQPFLYGNSSS